MNDSRRVLGFPPWVWACLFAVTTLAAIFVPPPVGIPEPTQETGMFQPPVLVTKTDEGYRIVPFDERGGKSPLWSVSPTVTAECKVDRTIGWSAAGFGAGFFQNKCRWNYRLSAVRFDANAGEKDLWMPDAEATNLRPLVTTELNRRSGDKRLGDQFSRFLDAGAERQSPSCVQNLIVLLAWILLIPLAWIAMLPGIATIKKAFFKRDTVTTNGSN
ncbi:MAG: hypothetical protein JWN70_4757 [Planctomycetaceae bacterium]|nr:hypothetical protein [Planctomycetaceae bacterium]